MQLKVRFFAAYRDATGQKELVVDAPTGTTPAGLLAQLADEYPRLAGIATTSAYAVNREDAPCDQPLSAGDEVAFLPPVSGGSGLFLVTEREITVDELVQQVVDPTAGAVVTFSGVVRGFSRGKPVRYLEYEAYKEMAEEKMAEIAREIQTRWGLGKVAVSHRTGHLEVGETSVIIAVAAPHRKEAFEACEYAIDRLKVFVPVWKKEAWADGEVWVGLEDDARYEVRGQGPGAGGRNS